MVRISIITVFPELHETFLNVSIIQRAQKQNLAEFNIVCLSDQCDSKERIDEPTCGPGAGMVIKPGVIEKAIAQCEQKWGSGFTIFFSPQGVRLSQPLLREFASHLLVYCPDTQCEEEHSGSIDHLILVCARYEGIDARVEQRYADAIISIGDYVLMGGDVPAHVFLEGLLRLVPGVVGKQESVDNESFSGGLLDYPEYGLPVEWNGMRVPEIVLSGNHKAIKQWRTTQACKRTLLRRFDWFRTHASVSDLTTCSGLVPNHYLALMHTDVIIKGGRVGETSVTSLDIHDLSRSATTYGMKNLFMVTPLEDQQKIMSNFLEFWKSEEGKRYNLSRHQAVGHLLLAKNLEDTIANITKIEGKKPLVIATSARQHDGVPELDYFSQGTVWSHDRPVLLLFGTAQGLSDHVVGTSDYILMPIEGMSDYNHLSVRSAVAIVLDRWFGLWPQKHTRFAKNDK